jgi:hypothetical protein
MGKCVALLAAVSVVLCCIGGCQSTEEKMFELLADSTLGIGVKFGTSPADANAVLGPPTGEFKKQGGANVEQYYLVPDPGSAELPVPDRNTTQFSATYLEGVLARVYNRYHPEEQQPAEPPHVIEPATGVKLGGTRGDFTSVLGTAADELGQSKWEFESADGEQVTILAHFIAVEGAPEELCDSLVVSFSESIANARGEAFDKEKERLKKIRGK